MRAFHKPRAPHLSFAMHPAVHSSSGVSLGVRSAAAKAGGSSRRVRRWAEGQSWSREAEAGPWGRRAWRIKEANRAACGESGW